MLNTSHSPTVNEPSSKSAKTGDFMSNLTPQWPEPEEPSSAVGIMNAGQFATAEPEHEPFLKRHSTFAPAIPGNKSKRARSGVVSAAIGGNHAHHGRPLRRGSKESISSSWSSLFNVPGSLSVLPTSDAELARSNGKRGQKSQVSSFTENF